MSLELFVEHLTGAPGPANEELFEFLVSTLPPRRRDAVVLHFYDGLPYRVVGEQLGVTATRATQLADMGVAESGNGLRWTQGLYLSLSIDQSMAKRCDR